MVASESGLLGRKPFALCAQVVKDPDQVGGARRAQGVLLGAADLHRKTEAEAEQQDGHDPLRPTRASPEGFGDRPPIPRRRSSVSGLSGVRQSTWRHPWKRWRRIAAALAKMRIEKTTTTPVDSCAPTPSWSPRKTTSAATRTLPMNEMTKTRSLKMPSSRARLAPKTASSAATTAIGR